MFRQLAEGTPVFYEGAGKYVPLANQGAYGNLSTFTTGDNKYKIRLGHMQSLGEAADLTGTKVADPSGAGTDPKEFLMGYLLGTGFAGEPQESGATKMKRQFVQQLLQPPQNNMFGQLLSMASQPYVV